MNALQTTRQETLRAAAEGRRSEVANYQINIDNFRLAIAKIDAEYSDNADMLAFAAQLKELLASSVREQLKEQIMLEVIEFQIEQDHVR
jgi:hypothetical protein